MMSDFSVGYFTRNENKEKVYPYLTEDELFIQYNDEWIGKLSALDWEKPQPQTVALSKEMPLLYVMNAEDHGFSMKILHDEEVKFDLDISYDIRERIFDEVAHELYGEDCWEIMMSSIGTSDNKMEMANQVTEKRIKDENILETAMKITFANINDDSLKIFEIFGFDEEIIQNLKQILTIKNGIENSHQMIYNLLDCLGLKQFSFVSYEYVSGGEDDRFEILNLNKNAK